ncbi:exported hypothetical protein [Acidobacteriia bacterium SbA2]|nr:exported hypothetical protein [Acidobacteriia bacterium SbA2]
MITWRWNYVAGRRAGFRPGAPLGVVILGLVFLAALPLGAQDKKDSSKNDSDTDQEGFGIVASKRAGAKDVGLPLYPGAREHKDKSEDSPGVKFGLWGGNSGFKLAVLKLESNDAPEKVAAFYRKALARYGKVLDCRGSSKAARENDKGSSELGCEDDQPENGELVLKAGTKQDQHLVGIKTSGGLTLFQLVYVMTRGSDTEQ